MEIKTRTCLLCGATAKCVYKDMKGYVEGAFFDIYECGSCNASFVDPLITSEELYNHIYDQGEYIPGYTRYFRYAELVKKVKRPLDVLAQSENVYWGVREAIKTFFGNRKDISILEIGSGLGYLTYSLQKAGLNTTGLDLSTDAVEKAKRVYGAFYEQGDLFALAHEKQKEYDCVIMTEMIEHVENPKLFIEAALSLLKSGGKLILTTPNKDASPEGVVWQSDVPPVHLWWLSERSIASIANSFGRSCTFIDFTPYTSTYYEYSTATSIDDIQAHLPRLDKEGKLIEAQKVNLWKTKLFGVVLHTKISNILRRLKSKTPSARSSSMCVVLQ